MTKPQGLSSDTQYSPLNPDLRQTGSSAENEYDDVAKNPVVGEETPPTRSRSAFRSCVDRFWGSEILNCCLSIVALAAIVITLAIHSGKPLPEWPHSITINTLIAIFTAVLKASMLMPIAQGISELKWLWFLKPRALADLDKFDSASRGPWGALCLLIDLNKHFLASLGAVLTIVAMAIDPFSQQIVQYYNCMQPLPDDVARIPWTNNYTGNYPHYAAITNAMDQRMALSIYTGLFNPPSNSSTSMSISCPSGNCTFPAQADATFSTLAICHSCQDISNLVANNSKGEAYLPSGARIGGFQTAMNTSFTASSNDEDPWWLLSFDSLMVQENSTLSDEEISNLRKNFSITTGGAMIPGRTFFATRCSLSPCVNTYGANITRGVYNETLVSSNTYPVPYRYRYDSLGWGIATNTTMRNGTRQDCNPSRTRTAVNVVPVNATDNIMSYKLDDSPDALWYPDDCVWMFTWAAMETIPGFFVDFFHNKTLTMPNGGPFNFTVGPLWLQNLYRNGTADMGSVSDYMQGLALSMTAVVRTLGDTPSSEYVKGTTLESQTCIRVRWAWISLPATSVLLTVLFLVLTMAHTAGHGWLGSWRSSQLALIFHGLDEKTRSNFGNMSSKSEMNDASEELKVRLSQNHERGGWNFVETKA